MKRAYGIIELLIAFLLLSVIVAAGMNMTLVQMNGKLKHTPIQEAQSHADSIIDNIENAKNIKLKQEQDVINNWLE